MTETDVRIAGLDSAQREPAGDDASAYTFLRPGDPPQPDGSHPVIGWIRINPDGLRIETNSQARADALRERVESACGGRLWHRAREHMDPLALRKGAGKTPPSPPPSPTPEQERLVAEFKARHYASWPDQPLPALNE